MKIGDKATIAEIKAALESRGSEVIRQSMSEVNPLKVATLSGKATPKWDGWYTAIVVEAGIGTMYSRSARYRENLDFKGVADGVYIGELIENTSWSYSFKDGAYHGKWVVFEMMNGDADYDKKLKHLAKIKWPDWVIVVEQFKGTPADAFLECELHDYEGLVVVDADGNKTKVKRRYEKDYLIMGFNQSSAEKYKGVMIKSVDYGDGTKVIGNLGSFKESMRKDMFQHPEKYLGKVITVCGKGLFPSGALRHPSFGSIRDPKDKSELGAADKADVSAIAEAQEEI